jgi:hypothetical protein
MMKQLLVSVVSLTLSLALCGQALSQATSTGSSGAVSKPKTGAKVKELHELTLDELYALALKHNAAIRAAEGKVREAHAALDRTRSEYLALIAQAHHELESARELDQEAKNRLNVELRLGPGVSSEREMSDARLTRVRTKLELAKAEGVLMTLVGKPLGEASTFDPMMRSDDVYGPRQAATPPAPAQLPETVRKALDAKVTVEFQDAPASDVIEHLQDLIQGVNLHLASNANIKDRKMTLRLKEKVPVAGVLQWLEDALDVKCVLRDYGIVVADRNAIPPGATLLLDAWRKQPAK